MYVTAIWNKARSDVMPTSPLGLWAGRNSASAQNLKNLNSFRNVEKAIRYENPAPGTYVLEEGGQVVQETRLWNPDSNKTASMRGKEEAHDYRYFPDPDLVPLIVEDAWIQDVKATMPELPDEKKQRFIKDYSLSDYDAGVLTASLDMADFFEQTIKPLKDIKQAANWIMTTLMGMLNAKSIEVCDSPVSAESFSRLLSLLESSKINANAAKTVFEEMVETGKDPETIVKEKGLEQVSDQGELEAMVEEVLKENPGEVDAYRDGKTKLFSFFMGQVMKKTRGKADPKVVTPMLKSKL